MSKKTDCQAKASLKAASYKAAWINPDFWDMNDSRVNKVRYQIKGNRYFYKSDPPGPLEDIQVDTREMEQGIILLPEEVGT